MGYPDILTDEVVQMYRAGLSLKRIGKYFEISHEAVRARLLKKEEPMRKRGGVLRHPLGRILRKHESQMTDLEKNCVSAYMRVNLHRVAGNPYFRPKGVDRCVFFDEAKGIIRYGTLIEVQRIGVSDTRAVFCAMSGICVVVSLLGCLIYTVYYQPQKKDVDLEDGYQWKDDLVPIVKSLHLAKIEPPQNL